MEGDGRIRGPCTQRTDAMVAVQGSMIASSVDSSMGSNTWLSSPGTAFATNLIVQETGLEWLEATESYTQLSEPSAALAQKSFSAPAPDLFPTTPGPLLFMATKRGDTC